MVILHRDDNFKEKLLELIEDAFQVWLRHASMVRSWRSLKGKFMVQRRKKGKANGFERNLKKNYYYIFEKDE